MDDVREALPAELVALARDCALAPVEDIAARYSCRLIEAAGLKAEVLAILARVLLEPEAEAEEEIGYGPAPVLHLPADWPQ